MDTCPMPIEFVPTPERDATACVLDKRLVWEAGPSVEQVLQGHAVEPSTPKACEKSISRPPHVDQKKPATVNQESSPKPAVHQESSPKPVVDQESSPKPAVDQESSPKPAVDQESSPWIWSRPQSLVQWIRSQAQSQMKIPSTIGMARFLQPWKQRNASKPIMKMCLGLMIESEALGTHCNTHACNVKSISFCSEVLPPCPVEPSPPITPAEQVKLAGAVPKTRVKKKSSLKLLEENEPDEESEDTIDDEADSSGGTKTRNTGRGRARGRGRGKGRGRGQTAGGSGGRGRGRGRGKQEQPCSPRQASAKRKSAGADDSAKKPGKKEVKAKASKKKKSHSRKQKQKHARRTSKMMSVQRNWRKRRRHPESPVHTTWRDSRQQKMALPRKRPKLQPKRYLN